MPGIDKILSTINQQSKENADSVINSAEKKAELIRKNGDESAKKAHDDYISRFISDSELKYSSACASAESAMKRKILTCKSECIEKSIEAALERLSNLPDDKYFSLILKLAGERLHSGKGIIQFSQKDLKRLPCDFEKNINAIAESNGSSVEISKIPANIEDGFILSYGNIYENCGFCDILESEKNAVRDLAASILFT